MASVNPVLLVILDGWGVAPPGPGNATILAKPACFNALMAQHPNSTLEASNEDVGLPDGQFGNSEVGHMNLGAGRVVYQDITRIDRDIRNGDFFKLPALKRVLDATQPQGPGTAKGGRIHFIGLVSDGGVHSIDRHYFALIDWLKREKFPGEQVFFHAITDGRDTSPTGGRGYIQALHEKLDAAGIGRIASVSGRYWAMDRDKRWERTERYYDMLTLGQADVCHDAVTAVEESYAAGRTDEFMEPRLIVSHGEPFGRLRDGDVVVWFNFRADRARQLCRALTLDNFEGFKRKSRPAVALATMTKYADDIPAHVCYPPVPLKNVLGDWLAQKGIAQFRCAETEKYAHVTYFFNGGVEQPFTGEERFLVPSPKVATYDLKPEMSAPEVSDAVAKAIESGKHPFVLVNFANPDMTGHTGMIYAAIKGCQATDAALAKILAAAERKGYAALITADHGNAEEMLISAAAANDPLNQEKGASYTAPSAAPVRDDGLVASTQHSHNPVPLILAGKHGPAKLKKGRLSDIAPTVLALMGVQPPPEMTGKSLIS
ncbi:MAG: 2,3-bisphosphoglycerate-independent phosphoglycerate mutase [Planctomycetes bacterium]|nr:2,3-bisphosphoglycerate-independent phosphoglycerate mutase [Planctomycetota bacterium]